MRFIKFIILFVLLACSKNKVPDDLLQPDKMKLIVFDLMRADEFVNGYVLQDTSLKASQEHLKMYQKIFAIHNTDKKEFYTSLAYYQQHPNVNKVLFDSLFSFANRKRDRLVDTAKVQSPSN